MQNFLKSIVMFGTIVLLGSRATATISSPDGKGYVYRDAISSTMNSISGTGASVNWSGAFGSHDYSDTKIPLGFSFTYYGVTYDSLYVMTCGWLSFVSQVAQLPTEDTFPQLDACDGVIAPLAITFDFPDVYYETQGTLPNRIFIVEWSGALTPDAEGFDFQVIFYEHGSRIEFVYNNLGDDGWFDPIQELMHVGIESQDESTGLEYSMSYTFNDVGLPTKDESILFGTKFVVTAPYKDTTHIGSFDITWTEISSDSNASIALYYDNGTDTSGILITSGITKQGADVYHWDGDGAVGLNTAVHIYGVFVEGTDTVVSYAPYMLTFIHGDVVALQITANLDTVALSDTAFYTVVATDTYGNSWDTTAGEGWSTMGAVAGVFTDGILIADSIGLYDVVYTLAGISDTVTLCVDGTVPVELSMFRAEVTEDGVALLWATETECDNLGFNILRSISESGPFNKINTRIISGSGTSTIPHSYSYTDEDGTGLLYYILEQIDMDGKRTTSEVLAVAAAVTSISLATLDSYRKRGSQVQLFDATGQPVKRIMASGVYLVLIDGMLYKKVFLK